MTYLSLCLYYDVGHVNLADCNMSISGGQHVPASAEDVEEAVEASLCALIGRRPRDGT
jgi:hypothetical protein